MPVLDLSILIVNWNTRDLLEECLRSIYHSVSGPSFEVIVVDNASQDGSVEMIKKGFPGTRLIENRENAGFAAANNQAYRISNGRFIGLLNPDTLVRHGTFESMLDHLSNHGGAGAVSCLFLNPDGTLQRDFFRRFPTIRSSFFRYTHVGRLIDQRCLCGGALDAFFYKERTFEDTETIDQPGAACLLIRRSLIDQIGLFDEQFPIFFNDVDLCRRIWNTGYQIHVLSHAQITHYGGSSIRKLPSEDVSRLATEGLYRYFKKHRGVFYASLVLCLLYADAWISKSLKPKSK